MKRQAPSDLYVAYKALALAPKLSLVCRRVAGALLAHYNTRTGQCDPSLNRLADLLAIGRKEVKAATAALSRDTDGLFDKDSHGGKFHRASYQPRWDRFAAIVSEWEDRSASNPDFPGPSEVGGKTPPLVGGKNPPLVGGKNPPLVGGKNPPQTLRSNSLKKLDAREPGNDSTRDEGRKGLRNGEPSQRAQRAFIYPIAGGKLNQPSHADAAREQAKRRIEIAIRPTAIAAWLADHDPQNVVFERAVDAEVAKRGAGLSMLLFAVSAGRSRDA